MPDRFEETFPILAPLAVVKLFIATLFIVTLFIAATLIAVAEVRRRTIRSERGRLARELHDSLSQDLTGLALMAEALRLSCPFEEDQRLLREIQDAASRCARQVRGSLGDLRAAQPQPNADLFTRLRSLAEAIPRERGVRMAIDFTGEAPELSATSEAQILLIVREALWNAVRHSGATQIEVRCSSGPDALSLAVRDNGRGFDPEAARPGHFGLDGIRERAAEIGVALNLSSGPQGTTVELIVRARTLALRRG